MFNIDLKNKMALYQLVAGLAAVALILLGCIVVLMPFFPAMILAVIFTLATWPAYTWLRRKTGGRTALASVLMTALLALCFVVPLAVIGTSVADNFDTIYSAAQEYLQGDPQAITGRIARFPLGGEHLAEIARELLSDRERLAEQLREYGGNATKALIKVGAVMGRGLLDITLGVFIAYFLFRYGAVVATRCDALIERVGGDHGRNLLNVCKNTLVGVVYGLLGAALVQATLAAAGFFLAGVPGASFLGFLTFIVAVFPMGPPVVWIPVVAWLFMQGSATAAVLLACYCVLVIGSIDNIMRPYFISRDSNLPFLLVLLGILGGVAAFGFIGIFIGPVLLALAYSLVLEWSAVRRTLSSSWPRDDKAETPRETHVEGV